MTVTLLTINEGSGFISGGESRQRASPQQCFSDSIALGDG